jgi:hypothetical protein
LIVKAAVTPTTAIAAADITTHLGTPRASAMQHPEEDDFFLQHPVSGAMTGHPCVVFSDLQHFPAIVFKVLLKVIK